MPKARWILSACALLFASQAWAAPTSKGDAALQQLMNGNLRFRTQRMQHPRLDTARIKETSKGQKPIAAILSCSDSRIPPEAIFDQGIGDVFVIRVAGNTLNNANLGSMEYAVEHLGVPLIMVLGHSHCGAVTAAVKGGEAPGHIFFLVESLLPAVKLSKGWPGDPVDNAVRANVSLGVKQLKASHPILAEAISEKKVKVVGATYELNNGVVRILN